MDKFELVQLTKFVCKEMDAYSNIRAGGNLGMIIGGYLISKEIKNLADVLSKAEATQINNNLTLESILGENWKDKFKVDDYKNIKE